MCIKDCSKSYSSFWPEWNTVIWGLEVIDFLMSGNLHEFQANEKTLCLYSNFFFMYFQFLFFKIIFVHLQLSHLPPNCSPLPSLLQSVPIPLSVPKSPLFMFFDLFSPLSPFPLPSDHRQFVCYFYFSGSVLLICLFSWLGSTYRWDHMVFVFHCLAYFT